MKTKKSWIMTLVLVLLVSLLAACGKKDAGNASPSASAPSSSEPAGETAQERSRFRSGTSIPTDR